MSEVPRGGDLRTGKFLVCLAKLGKLAVTCTPETIMKTPTLLAAVTLSLLTALPAMAACSDPAGPHGEWSGCKLEGVSLQGADLTGARLDYTFLTGANLQDTTLREARLNNANLDTANLTNAKLDSEKLGSAGLSFATWINGRTCAAGSIGTCN